MHTGEGGFGSDRKLEGQVSDENPKEGAGIHEEVDLAGAGEVRRKRGEGKREQRENFAARSELKERRGGRKILRGESEGIGVLRM